MRSSACSNAEAWVSAAATVSGEALGGPTTVRLTRPIRPRFSPSKLSRARSMERSTAEKRASSLTASRSDDLAIKGLQGPDELGRYLQRENTQRDPTGLCSARRYKSKSKGSVILPNDLASSADFPVAGQNQEELVSTD